MVCANGGQLTFNTCNRHVMLDFNHLNHIRLSGVPQVSIPVYLLSDYIIEGKPISENRHFNHHFMLLKTIEKYQVYCTS